MHRRFYETITYPYSVPRLERLLRMFGQKFGKLLGMEVFKALLDFSTFVQHLQPHPVGIWANNPPKLQDLSQKQVDVGNSH